MSAPDAAWWAGIRWPDGPGTWADWFVAIGALGTLIFTATSAMSARRAAISSRKAAEDAGKMISIERTHEVALSARRWESDIKRAVKSVKNVTSKDGGFPKQKQIVRELEQDAAGCNEIAQQMDNLTEKIRSEKRWSVSKRLTAEAQIEQAKRDIRSLVDVSLNRQRDYLPNIISVMREWPDGD